MENVQLSSFNDVCFLNPQITTSQLISAINMRLCKLEALSAIIATIDLDTYTQDTIDNYLWGLSDMVHEAKLLCEYAMNKFNKELFLS